MLIGASGSDLVIGGVIIVLSGLFAFLAFRYQQVLGAFFAGRAAGGATAHDVERFFRFFALFCMLIGLYAAVFLVVAAN